MRRSVRYLLTAATFLIITALVAPAAQEQRKVVEWANHRSINSGEITEPWSRQIEAIELEQILIAGRAVTIGDPVPAGIDWINEVSFRVKNISAEDVLFIQITLVLPELKHSPQIPYLALCGNRENQICLRPGEEVELKIGGKGQLYDWVKEQVSRERELSSINRAAIDAVYVATRRTGVVMAGCVRTSDPRNTCPHKYS